MPRIITYRQRCANCGHDHVVEDHARCLECDCNDFLFTPETVADLELAEAAIAVEYDGDQVLGAEMVEALLRTCDTLESAIECVPWGQQVPVLFLVHGSVCPSGTQENVDLFEVATSPARLPDETWTQPGCSPLDMLTSLSVRATENPEWFCTFCKRFGMGDLATTIGAGFFHERRTVHNFEPRLGRERWVRSLCMVDADARQYSVLRSQDGEPKRLVTCKMPSELRSVWTATVSDGFVPPDYTALALMLRAIALGDGRRRGSGHGGVQGGAGDE